MKKKYRKPLVRIEKGGLECIDLNGKCVNEKGTIMVNGTECFEKEIKMRELGGKESETV